jgi:predicted anti-sigma-YlaC factor YlaD
MTNFYYYGGRHVEREILSALIDGELTPNERHLVHEHLQECSACREAADEFGQIHGMMGDLPRLIAPEAFVSAALRPKRTVATKLFGGKRKFVAGGVAFSAIAISVAGLFVPQRATTPPVDVFFERQVSLHTGEESGGQVLFAVNNR